MADVNLARIVEHSRVPPWVLYGSGNDVGHGEVPGVSGAGG
jgi:hypothetical protein